MASPDPGAFVERLARERLIAILRAPDADRFVAVASALYDGGWRGIEVTLTTDGALDAIGALREALPEDAWIGAGTVMSAAEVQAVHAAGAQFAVSPVLDDGSVAAAGRRIWRRSGPSCPASRCCQRAGSGPATSPPTCARAPSGSESVARCSARH